MLTFIKPGGRVARRTGRANCPSSLAPTSSFSRQAITEDGIGSTTLIFTSNIYVPSATSMQHKRKACSASLGVSQNGQKRVAGIRIQGKHTYLGSFSKEEEAAEAYSRAMEDKYRIIPSTKYRDVDAAEFLQPCHQCHTHT